MDEVDLELELELVGVRYPKYRITDLWQLSRAYIYIFNCMLNLE